MTPPPAQHPRPAELLVAGWARLYADGFPAGTDILRQALVAFQHEPLSTTVEIQGLWLACGVAKALWDEGRWRTVGQRYLQLTREAGALAALPRALTRVLEFLVEIGRALRSRRPRRRVTDDRRCNGHHLLPLDDRHAVDARCVAQRPRDIGATRRSVARCASPERTAG